MPRLTKPKRKSSDMLPEECLKRKEAGQAERVMERAQRMMSHSELGSRHEKTPRREAVG